MDTPVLKPGGFWICPTCGQRNKVWAPCSHCGTALSDMAVGADEAPSAEVERRRSPLLYVLGAAGVAAALALALGLTRLLGGASVGGSEDLSEPGVRAAITPRAAPQAPVAVPDPPPPTPAPAASAFSPPAFGAASAPPPDLAPEPPPSAVYGPGAGGRSPGYSIPAPSREETPYRAGARDGGGLRAREQAVRAARERFARAEAALASAESGDTVPEAVAEQLETAARELREAEAALDRARRRPPRP